MFLPIIGKFVKHKANWSIRMAQLRIVLMIRNIIIIMQTELPIILPNNMWIAPQSRLLWMLEIYKNDWYWLFESPWHFRTVNHHAKHPEKKNMSTDVHGCPRIFQLHIISVRVTLAAMAALMKPSSGLLWCKPIAPPIAVFRMSWQRMNMFRLWDTKGYKKIYLANGNASIWDTIVVSRS